MVCVGFEGTTLPSSLRHLLDRGVSSVILFSRNFQSPEQLCNLCVEIKEAVDRPIMICVDQEGGRVQRFHKPFTIVPPMREIGSMGSERLAEEVGGVFGRELRSANIDMDIAPVLDVDSNPDNPVIGPRSFGSVPDIVARFGCAMIRGLQQAGVAACGKHFPGHGDTRVDSHLDLPCVSHDVDRLNRVELPPFVAAIEAGVAALMTSHIVFQAIDPAQPATMSKAVIGDLLRTRMKYDRLVISDDLEMRAITNHFGIDQAVIAGTRAGVDLFMICSRKELQSQAIDALTAAVESGTVSRTRIEQANRHLDELFDRFVRPPVRWNPEASSLIGCAKHQEIVRGVTA